MNTPRTPKPICLFHLPFDQSDLLARNRTNKATAVTGAKPSINTLILSCVILCTQLLYLPALSLPDRTRASACLCAKRHSDAIGADCPIRAAVVNAHKKEAKVARVLRNIITATRCEVSGDQRCSRSGPIYGTVCLRILLHYVGWSCWQSPGFCRDRSSGHIYLERAVQNPSQGRSACTTACGARLRLIPCRNRTRESLRASPHGCIASIAVIEARESTLILIPTPTRFLHAGPEVMTR